MKNKTSGFAGFLNGYKASNIASAASSFEYHLDEIQDKVQSILEQQSEKKASKDIFNSLSKAQNILNQSNIDLMSKAIKFGEAFKMTILTAKKTTESSRLLTDERMRRIAYHFLALADKSEDKSIGDIAIEIGESF